jgi:hypothetical protein
VGFESSSSVSTTMRDTVGPNDSVAYMSISLVTPSTTIGPALFLVNAAGVAKNKKLVTDAVSRGATLLFGDANSVHNHERHCRAERLGRVHVHLFGDALNDDRSHACVFLVNAAGVAKNKKLVTDAVSRGATLLFGDANSSAQLSQQASVGTRLRSSAAR